MLNKKWLIYAVAMIAMAATTKVVASELEQLDEVVVTATRTTTGLADAPAAVTVVTAKQIESKNVSRLGDALNSVPSLFMRAGALGDSQGTQGTSGMSLRGVDYRKILVLVDGQPIQDAGSGQINWRTVFVNDIARVEVVPGAFSSLYGSNAIGGVINVITKKPDKHELTLKVRNGWGDAKGQDASVYFRDKFDNGMGVVAGLGYQERASYVNDFVVRTPVAGVGLVPVTGAQATTNSAGAPAYIVGDKGAAPWRQVNATTKLYYDLNAEDKVFAGVAYSETDLGYTYFSSYLRNTVGAPVVSGTSLAMSGKKLTLSEANFVNNSPLFERATRYFAGYDGTLGTDMALKFNVARINRQYQFVNAGTTATWASGAGTQTQAPNYGFDSDVQLTLPLGERQIMVGGMALHREVVDGTSFMLANWRDPTSRNAVDSGYSGISTTTSLFVQDEVSVTDRLQVYVGGRYDDWQTKGSYFKNAAPATAINYAARNAASFNGKLSGVYRATQGVTLRASYGQSFHAPTNNDLYSYTSIAGITSIGDPNLNPEKGTSWEFGLGWQVSKSTKFNTTYYQTEIQDLITNRRISNFPIVSQRINAGRAKISGIELSADTALTNWLDMNASYAYIGSKMLENAIDPLSVGKRLIDSPQNIVTLGFSAKHGAWSGTLNASYYGKVYSTAQNTDVAQGVPGAYDPRTLVNSKVAYAFSQTTKGYFAINNLLGEKSYSFFLNPGRSLTVGLDISL